MTYARPMARSVARAIGRTLNEGGGVQDYLVSSGTTILNWASSSPTFAGTASKQSGLTYNGQGAALKITNNGGNSYGQVASMSVDMSDWQTLGVPIYRAPGLGKTTIDVFLTRDAFATFLVMQIIVDDIGWGFYTLCKSAAVGGGVTIATPFNTIRVREQPGAGTYYTVGTGDTYIGNIVKNVMSRPKFMLCFDDSKDDLMTTATSGKTLKSIMDSYGFKGTVYALPAKHGTAGYESTANILTLHDQGWHIANHSRSHPADGSSNGLRLLGPYGFGIAFDNSVNHPTRVSTNNDTAIYDDIMEGVTDLVAMGIPEDEALHFAIPQGGWDTYVISALERSGMKSIRNISTTTLEFYGSSVGKPTGLSYPGARVPTVVNLRTSTVVETAADVPRMQAAVDGAIATGAAMTSVTHDLAAATITNLEGLCAYLQTKQAAGLIDVVTVKQWYDGLRRAA